MWDQTATAQLENVPWVRHVEFHPTIGSTNNRARELIGQAVELPALVVAAQQTQGRGRLGRNWWSPPGALLCSLVVGSDVGPAATENASVLALWTGVALAEGLARIEPTLPAWLKWPNDLMVADSKLAGILVETAMSTDSGPVWIVGFGLNVNNRRLSQVPDLASRDLYQPLSLYDFTGRTYPLVEVLHTVLHSLASTYAALRGDPQSLPERWQTYCGLHGKVVQIATAEQKSVQGVCLGIDGDGALKLQTASGEVTRCIVGSVIEWEAKTKPT